MNNYNTLRLENGALQLDASSIEGRFCKCPRMFHYYHNLRRVSTAPSTGRNFGSFFHDVLEAHYRGVKDIDFQAFYNARCQGMPDGDFRTVGFGRELYELYCRTYAEEPFKIVDVSDGDIGVMPANEVPFACPIGTLKTAQTPETSHGVLTPVNPVDDIPQIWTGKLDLLTEWPDGTFWVMDHKTSSVAGDTFWADFVNSTAQHGYVWAAQRALGRPVAGFIINAIFVRQATRTGKGCELFRQRYPVSQEKLEEFVTNSLHIGSSILDCAERNYWPMHTSACVARFGKCEYMPVCENDAQNRQVVLDSNLYKDNTWSPLHDV